MFNTALHKLDVGAFWLVIFPCLHCVTLSLIVVQLEDHAEVAMMRFLKEQEVHTQELEKQLDQHIAYLRQATDNAVHKYTSQDHWHMDSLTVTVIVWVGE